MVIGVVWYKEEDYPILKELFEDGDTLPDSYSEWLEKAQNLFNQLIQRGFTPIKVYINPDTFPKWCIERGHSLNAKARTAYANFVAANSIHNNH